MHRFEDIFEAIAKTEASHFVWWFRTNNMRAIIDWLVLYTWGGIPWPIQALWIPPSGSNAEKLLRQITSAAGLVLNYSAELIRDQDKIVPPNMAEFYMNDPIFLKLRALVESINPNNVH